MKDPSGESNLPTFEGEDEEQYGDRLTVVASSLVLGVVFALADGVSTLAFTLHARVCSRSSAFPSVIGRGTERLGRGLLGSGSRTSFTW